MNSLRLFVAAYPPPEITAELTATATQHAPANARLTPPDQIHLTLLFLGSVRTSDIDTVAESMDRAASGRGDCTLRITSVASLPESGEPRLLAALADADTNALEVQRRLASRLAILRPKASREKFAPHLTLARFQPATPRLARQLITPLVWTLRSMRLMRSTLRPGGAVHSLVHETTLQ
jgi:2'-5' RNA ligase